MYHKLPIGLLNCVEREIISQVLNLIKKTMSQNPIVIARPVNNQQLATFP